MTRDRGVVVDQVLPHAALLKKIPRLHLSGLPPWRTDLPVRVADAAAETLREK